MIGDIAVLTVHDIYRLFIVSLRSLNWSFIMEAILWRMWRHVITWPLSSLKCIDQRSGRFQKVIINKMGVLGGYFQLRQCLVYLMTKSNKIEKNIFCVICPLTNPPTMQLHFPLYDKLTIYLYLFILMSKIA